MEKTTKWLRVGEACIVSRSYWWTLWGGLGCLRRLFVILICKNRFGLFCWTSWAVAWWRRLRLVTVTMVWMRHLLSVCRIRVCMLASLCLLAGSRILRIMGWRE